MTRLDDLLSYEDQGKRPRSRRPSVRGFGVPIGVVVVSLIVYSLPRKGLGIGAPFLVILAVVAALAVLQQTIRVLDIRRIPITLRDNPQIMPSSNGTTDGIRAASRGWNQRLEYAQDDPKHFARIVRPAFVEIIDERLRLAHGVTRDADPEQYRALVGPDLWNFMTKPVPRRVTPQLIATLVAQMEAL